MDLGLLSRMKEQEGVKKLVVWGSERLLLPPGCSSTLYLQENSKPRRLTKLSWGRARLASHSPNTTLSITASLMKTLLSMDYLCGDCFHGFGLVVSAELRPPAD